MWKPTLVAFAIMLGAQELCAQDKPAQDKPAQDKPAQEQPAQDKPAQDKPVYLEQGWSDDERQEYYYTPQGSDLLPYSWFLALEQPYTRELFRADEHMERLRFNPNSSNKFNPDGLPVGFVKGNGPDGSPWLGLTCAACHTGQMTYRGTSIRVDGGTTLADMTAFSQTLVDSLRATLATKGKFTRFSNRVLGDANDANSKAGLRKEVKLHLDDLAKWAASSRPAHPTGFANWDAVNILMNTINGDAIGAPENFRMPNTPVSFPSIWLSSEVDRLLWNGAVHNLTLRQVGEVIIVFGRASAKKTKEGFEFDSSADLKRLQSIYYTTDKLKPPPWPAKVLGEIDSSKAARGAHIYEREKCGTCHANKAPYPMTDANRWGKRFIKITRTPIAEVGTDPDYAVRFVSRTAQPGPLAAAFNGTPFEGKQVIPGAVLFLTVLQQITLSEVARITSSEEERDELLGHREMPQLPKNDKEVGELIQSLLVYKAAPLAGIWSTAPYLHNASVPSLYELLLPPEERSKKFRLGNREFDPKRVGYQTGKSEPSFEYDTTVPGFSNRGHAYGTAITESERWELLEYLKTL